MHYSIDILNLFVACDDITNSYSNCFHRAYASHINMPKELREELGIFDTTVRLSVGIEHIDDLVRDLEQALEKAFA